MFSMLKIIIIILALVALIAFFFPKVYFTKPGAVSQLRANEEAKRQGREPVPLTPTKVCIGFTHIDNTSDGGPIYYICYGIPVAKKS